MIFSLAVGSAGANGAIFSPPSIFEIRATYPLVSAGKAFGSAPAANHLSVLPGPQLYAITAF